MPNNPESTGSKRTIREQGYAWIAGGWVNVTITAIYGDFVEVQIDHNQQPIAGNFPQGSQTAEIRASEFHPRGPEIYPY